PSPTRIRIASNAPHAHHRPDGHQFPPPCHSTIVDSFAKSARNTRFTLATTGDATAMTKLAVICITQPFELFFIESNKHAVSVLQAVDYFGLRSAGGTDSDQRKFWLSVFVLLQHACLSMIGRNARRRNQQNIVLLASLELCRHIHSRHQ